MGGGVIITLG